MLDRNHKTGKQRQEGSMMTHDWYKSRTSALLLNIHKGGRLDCRLAPPAERRQETVTDQPARIESQDNESLDNIYHSHIKWAIAAVRGYHDHSEQIVFTKQQKTIPQVQSLTTSLVALDNSVRSLSLKRKNYYGFGQIRRSTTNNYYYCLLYL